MKSHFFNIILLLFMLCPTEVCGRVYLDQSFDSLPGARGYFYQPWLVNRNIRTLPGGEILHSTAGILTDRRNYDYATNTTTALASIYYAVIEYPGQGVYYGLVQVHPSKGFDNGFHLLGGRFYFPDGTSKFCFGKTPAEWKKEGVTKPSGTYTYHTYAEGFGSEPGKDDIALSYTFNPGGTLTATFTRQYTDYAQQEVAGTTTTTKKTPKGRRTKSTTQLTGGWYFDVTAKATCSGKWTLKNDTLRISLTGKPTYTSSAKFNRERLIDGWKKEDAARFFEFKMDTYRRQYLAQAQADYPNYRVGEEKQAAIDYLKENYSGLSNAEYVVRALGRNDLTLVVAGDKDNTFMSFQKKPDWGTWFNSNDFKEGFHALYTKWDEVKKYIVKIRNEKILNQIEASSAGLGATGDMFLVNLTDDGSSATLCAMKNSGEKPEAFFYDVTFDGDKAMIDPSSAKKDLSLDNAIAEMEANDKTLLTLSESKDKKDKDAKKAAKKYLKIAGKNPVSTRYSSLGEYATVLKAVRQRVELQKQYIP